MSNVTHTRNPETISVFGNWRITEVTLVYITNVYLLICLVIGLCGIAVLIPNGGTLILGAIAYYSSVCTMFFLFALFGTATACASAPAEVKINRGIEFTKNQLQAVDLSPQDFEMATLHPETIVMTAAIIFAAIMLCCCSFWVANKIKKGYQHRGSRYHHTQHNPQPQDNGMLPALVSMMGGMFNRQEPPAHVVYTSAPPQAQISYQPSAPPSYKLPPGI